MPYNSARAASFGDTPYNPWLHRLAIVSSIFCFFLLFMGGLVTSHQAGLSVPDWPTTYGWNMFTFPMKDWMGGIFYEHTHRLVASFVGFLILVQALAWRGLEQGPRMLRRLWIPTAILSLLAGLLFAVGAVAVANTTLALIGAGLLLVSFLVIRSSSSSLILKLSWLALAGVVLQGVLGGLTVLLYLPPLVSSAHAGLGQAVFCITLGIAMVTGKRWNQVTTKIIEPSRFGVRTLSLITVIFIFIQLLVGAWMRHTFAGLAIPTFPFAPNGGLIPDLNSFETTINFLHTRVGATIVTLLMFTTARVVFRYHAKNRRLARAMLLAMLLLGIQIALGAITIWTSKAVTPTTLHVSCGAAILGTMTYVMVLSRHLYVAKAGHELVANPAMAGANV